MTRIHITEESTYSVDFEEISENYQGNSFRSLYIDFTQAQLLKAMAHLGATTTPDCPYVNLWMTHAQTPDHMYLIFSYCFGIERDAILYEKHKQITTYNPHNMFKSRPYSANLFLYSKSADSRDNRLILRVSKH